MEAGHNTPLSEKFDVHVRISSIFVRSWWKVGTRPPASSCRRLHGTLAQQGGRFRRCHKLDQVTRHSFVLRNVAHCDAEVAVFDQLGWQGTEISGAGDRLDYIGLLDTDLDLALGDGNRHRFARNDFDLVLNLIVDAKLLEQPRVVGTGSCVAMAD